MGVVTYIQLMANKNVLFVMLLDHATRFKAQQSQVFAKFNRYVALKSH